MNTNDELLIRSLAALREETTDDHRVELHLAEFRVAYARLGTDSAMTEELDALIADGEELVKPGMGASPSDWNALGLAEPREANLKQEKELDALRADLETRREEQRVRRPRWMSRMNPLSPIFTTAATLMMIAASVVLGIFGSLSQMVTILPAAIFAITPAVALLLRSFLLFYLARRAAGDGPDRAEYVLRLMLGGLAVDMRRVEARENVAISALQSVQSYQGMSMQLYDDHIQLHRGP